MKFTVNSENQQNAVRNQICLLIDSFSVVVVHGKKQVLRPQVGDPKLEHFAQLHFEETSTAKQNEELPNGNDQARNNRYIRSTQLKRLYREDSMSFRRLVRNIEVQEEKVPKIMHSARLIRVRNNIPRGYFLDPRGRPRVIVQSNI
ncbi:hypothetical protein WA026_019127 [Henosepilachna vigintioctopunctata]|uniref:Uncharacterized protein n=1 Tax=Henosepilachna vigintioctopunctata TaxID=420089 RepID=A0AAW1UWL2_9CUCU